MLHAPKEDDREEQPEWASKLPPLPTPSELVRGPTGYSNWVVPGRLMAGAYPASLNDYEHINTILSILKKGIDTFCCLQAEAEQYCPESRWRKGQGIRTYLQDARELLKREQSQLSQRKVDWLHCKIRDGFIGPDEVVMALVEHLCARFVRGDVLYVHCWGGHGRTGTIVSLMLVYLYGLSADEAMKIVQWTHDRRKNPQNMRSPESPAQIAQVRRLAQQVLAIRRITPPVLRVGGAMFAVDNYSIAADPLAAPAPVPVSVASAASGAGSPDRDRAMTPHSVPLAALAAAGAGGSPRPLPAARSPSVTGRRPGARPAGLPAGRWLRPRTQDGSGAFPVASPSGRVQLHLPGTVVTASSADPLARSAPARLAPAAHAARSPSARRAPPVPSHLPLAARSPSLQASHAGSPRLAPPGPAGASPSLASKSMPAHAAPRLERPQLVTSGGRRIGF
eukprot:tig00000615_g2549.t1